MEIFPKENLVPTHATILGLHEDISIEVFFESFELNHRGFIEIVNGSLILEEIQIPIDPNELQNKSYSFPLNPENGYIDSSFYLLSIHNPIDISEIQFGEISNNALPIKIHSRWILEFEKTGFENFDFIIETEINLLD